MRVVLFETAETRLATWSRRTRIVGAERLATAHPGAVRQNLRDLVRLNRYLGPHRLLHQLVAGIAASGEAFTFLDVGAASGDMGDSLQCRFPHATGCSVDLRPSHMAEARGARVVADARRLPFAERSFDVVFCALLLHEFADDEAIPLLSYLHRLARRALIVLDLYRHPFAYHFLPATRRIFGWGDITVHDGQVSVAAGFLPSDLQKLARDAGLRHIAVRRHLPWFRVSLVARR